jgi:hypothetical protein
MKKNFSGFVIINNYLGWVGGLIGLVIASFSASKLIEDLPDNPRLLRIFFGLGYLIFIVGIIWFAYTAAKAKRKLQVRGALIVLYLITILFSGFVGTWLITSRNLPKQGQLIIPNSYLFKIPNRMIGTIWYLPSSTTTLEQASIFGADVASNRIVRYGGRVEDYPTIILMSNRLPPGDKSTCQGFGQGQIGNPGTTVGDNACLLVLEYRFK